MRRYCTSAVPLILQTAVPEQDWHQYFYVPLQSVRLAAVEQKGLMTFHVIAMYLTCVLFFAKRSKEEILKAALESAAALARRFWLCPELVSLI